MVNGNDLIHQFLIDSGPALLTNKENTLTEEIQNYHIASSYDACSIIEGFCGWEPEEDEIIAAFQFLIDSGDAWRLQGFYGRNAAALIERGLCRPAQGSVH